MWVQKLNNGVHGCWKKKKTIKQANKLSCDQWKCGLLKNNITYTHSFFQPSHLQRIYVQKLQSWNSDPVPILMLNTGTNQLITLLKLQCLIIYLAIEIILQLVSSKQTHANY
jgi:hypothetical protein